MNLVKNEKLENNSHELQFSIDAVTFSAAVDKAFKKEVAKYNIPGFRKGKAPRSHDRKKCMVRMFSIIPQSTICSLRPMMGLSKRRYRAGGPSGSRSCFCQPE